MYSKSFQHPGELLARFAIVISLFVIGFWQISHIITYVIQGSSHDFHWYELYTIMVNITICHGELIVFIQGQNCLKNSFYIKIFHDIMI